MKKIFTLSCVSVLFLSTLIGQTHKTIHVATPGTLSAALTAEEKSSVTHLTVTGTIDSMDFITLNQNIPHLCVLDLTGCSSANNAICNDAFLYKRSLDTILLPSTIKRIGNEAFLGCEFKSIILPPGLQVIEHSAFAYCPIKEITLPSSIQVIEGSIFQWCDSLNCIDVEAGNTYFCDVDGVLFNHDTTEILIYPQAKMGKYSIPGSVTRIDNGAFANCHGVDSLIIPASLQVIGDLGLYGCRSLINIIVDESNEYFCEIDGVLFSKDSTTLIRFPSKKPGTHYEVPYGVTTLGADCFHFCNQLLTLSLPLSLVKIGDGALRECYHLTALDLPASVDTIKMHAFMYCRAMEKIRIPSSVSYIGRYFLSVADELDTLMVNSPVPFVLGPTINYFEMVDTNNCILLVPSGSAEAYRLAAGWKAFVNIEEYEIAFEVSETEFDVASNESSLSFSITSNTDWSIHSSATWITASDTIGAYDKTITITVSANPGSTERQAIITVSAAGSMESTISVYQEALATSVPDQENTLISQHFDRANLQLVVRGAEGLYMQVFSADGKIWKTRNLGSNDETIRMDDLPSGVYIIKTGTAILKIVF